MEADTVPHPNKDGRKDEVVLYAIGALCALCLISWVISKMRISRTEDLPDDCEGTWRYGRVAGIADGDGFWFFDCPWLASRYYTRKEDKLYVRLAGIDAPEMGNGKVKKQFFAEESKEHLANLIRDRSIKIKIVKKKDQYDRVLAFAYLPRWYIRPFFNWWFPVSYLKWFEKDSLYINVNLEQVDKGYAFVYTGMDAIYDNYKDELMRLQEKAKREKKGMWIHPNLETPMEFKRRMKYR